jgi:hypothetical protein
MNVRGRSTLLLLLVAISVGLFVLSSVSASATIITYELDTEFSGADQPEGDPPWLTAAFDDGGAAGSVTLTLDAFGLTEEEFVSEWYFNVDDSVDLSGLIWGWDVTTMVSWWVSMSVGSGDDFHADGDGYFDFVFGFPTSGDVFGAGEVSVMEFTYSGLTASDFDFPSVGSKGAGTRRPMSRALTKRI